LDERPSETAKTRERGKKRKRSLGGRLNRGNKWREKCKGVETCLPGGRPEIAGNKMGGIH